jgi:uncharacterized protein (DUF885 family)
MMHILLAALVFPAMAAPMNQFEARCMAIVQSGGSYSERLKRLFDYDWKHQMEESPESATFNGYPGQNDRWTDMSLEAIERRKHESRTLLQALRKIKSNRLKGADRLNYDLFRKELEDDIEGQRFPSEFLAVNQLGGLQQGVPQILACAPGTTVKDYEDMITRLKRVPKLVDQTIVLLEEGLKRGITEPKIAMRAVPDQIKRDMEEDPEKNPFLTRFKKIPDTIPAAERERLKKDAASALRDSVLPALAKFHKFVDETYVPRCRETIALSALPEGKDWYAYSVRRTTTTRLTPEQVHEIGLSEVKRIRKEMDGVMASTGFSGSFDDFKKFLRTDSRFFYDKPEELLAGYRDIAKRIDPKLIELFGKLPRTTYGVKPVPAYAEKSQTTA